MGPSVVQPAAPPIAAVPFTPNTNVVQPRVWQDPNPIVSRQQAAPGEGAPQRQRPPVVSENPGLRAPAVPMSKEPRERAIQRGEAPQNYVAPAPSTPSAPPRAVEQRAAPAAPRAAEPRAAEPRAAAPRAFEPRAVEPRPAPVAPPPPPRAVEPRAAPVQVAPPTAPAAPAVERGREQPRAAPAPVASPEAPRGPREKERAPSAPPREQP